VHGASEYILNENLPGIEKVEDVDAVLGSIGAN
jgi:hypothetical protein